MKLWAGKLALGILLCGRWRHVLHQHARYRPSPAIVTFVDASDEPLHGDAHDIVIIGFSPGGGLRSRLARRYRLRSLLARPCSHLVATPWAVLLKSHSYAETACASRIAHCNPFWSGYHFVHTLHDASDLRAPVLPQRRGFFLCPGGDRARSASSSVAKAP